MLGNGHGGAGGACSGAGPAPSAGGLGLSATSDREPGSPVGAAAREGGSGPTSGGSSSSSSSTLQQPPPPRPVPRLVATALATGSLLAVAVKGTPPLTTQVEMRRPLVWAGEVGATLSLFAQRVLGVLYRYLGSSDYLGGMLAMSAMGVARDAMAWLIKQFRLWVIRRLWVSISLMERDAELLLAWLRERPEVNNAPQLALFSRGLARGDGRLYEYEPEIQMSTVLRVQSKAGTRHWVWITRRESSEFESQSDRRLRGVQISFIGRWTKAVLEEILEAGREIQRRKREKYLTVVQVYDFGKDYGLGWLHPQESDRKQPGRSIASVVLPRVISTDNKQGLDQAEALLEDAREFLASESWYSERGIPYRRGYLLHGIPGGGKSSLIMAVASELRLPIYMLQLSSELISDESLNSLLQHGMHDPPTILLLEDVDLLHAATLNRTNASEHREAQELAEDSSVLELRRGKDAAWKRKGGGRLTLSGLLNALDGPTATTGRLLFMTTNAKHRLDPALIRSGRIDYEIEFKHADREQICRFLTRFYSDFESSRSGSTSVPRTPSGASVSELAARFADQVEASGAELTTADIQRHLMKHKKDLDRALLELPTLLQQATAAKVVPATDGKQGPAASAAAVQEARQSTADSAKEPKGPAEEDGPTKKPEETEAKEGQQAEEDDEQFEEAVEQRQAQPEEEEDEDEAGAAQCNATDGDLEATGPAADGAEATQADTVGRRQGGQQRHPVGSGKGRGGRVAPGFHPKAAGRSGPGRA